MVEYDSLKVTTSSGKVRNVIMSGSGPRSLTGITNDIQTINHLTVDEVVQDDDTVSFSVEY